MFPLYVSADKSDNIFGLFRNVYVFARLWGYVPLSVNLNNVPLPHKVKVSFSNGFLLLIQTSVYMFFMVVNLIFSYSPVKPQVSSLVSVGLNKLNEIGILCGIVFIWADVVNRQRIWRILQKFLQFDREVQNGNSTM